MFSGRGGVEMGRRLSVDNRDFYHHLHFARLCEMLKAVSEDRPQAGRLTRPRFAAFFEPVEGTYQAEIVF